MLATVATFSNLNAATGYTQHTYSLAAYAGQAVTLKFTGAEDSEYQTSFVIDDTALNLGQEAGLETPQPPAARCHPGSRGRMKVRS